MNIPYVFKKCNKCGEWLVACNVNFNKNKTCKYGLSSFCKKCRAEYQKHYNKQYYEGNRDKISKQKKQYYKENKDKKNKYNKQYRENNKDKERKRHKQYHKENKDKIAEQQKQYYKENKDKIAEYKKQYYEDNRNKILEYHEQYRKNNKDKIKQYCSSQQGQIVRFNGQCKRRLKEQNQGNGITKEQWFECMRFFNWECAYSGIQLNKDNRSIDHIVPLNQGGEHEIWNLVPMYKPYNSSKHDKDMEEWYKEQDFYSEERLQKIYEWQEYAYNKYSKKIKSTQLN